MWQLSHEIVRSVVLFDLMMHLCLLLLVWYNSTGVNFSHDFKSSALKISPGNSLTAKSFCIRALMSSFSA
jgi:hypothetical protein